MPVRERCNDRLRANLNIGRPEAWSVDPEQFLEIRHVEYLTDRHTAVRQANLALGRLGLVSQHQQHAERRAVQIGDGTEIDIDGVDLGVLQQMLGFFAEVPMGREVEAPPPRLSRAIRSAMMKLICM